jgi:hypothetical protein
MNAEQFMADVLLPEIEASDMRDTVRLELDSTSDDGHYCFVLMTLDKRRATPVTFRLEEVKDASRSRAIILNALAALKASLGLSSEYFKTPRVYRDGEFLTLQENLAREQMAQRSQVA